MSEQAVQAVADGAFFAPTGKPWLMTARHVAFDEVTGSERFEARASRRLLAREPVLLIGPSGTGKTSLAAWVSAQLPQRVVSVRLLVSALDDPTDAGEVMKLALGTMLDVIQVDADTREELHIERADSRAASRSPLGVTGGKLGGGVIPVEVNIEVGSLRQEFKTDKLRGEYLAGVNRAVAILADKGIETVFVMDDVEAIVGAEDQAAVADGFVDGPVRMFVEEVDAGFLLAIQPHLVEESSAYERLSPAMLAVTLPRLAERAQDGLAQILLRCLEVAESPYGLDDVMSDDALTGLVQFYDDTEGDIRKTLSAANYAADDAASMKAQHIKAPHVRVGASQAR
jgi:hypothetical protein